MPRSRKNKFIFFMFFLGFWSLVNFSNAADFGVVVKRADLVLQETGVELHADVSYLLSSQAQQALQSGIPLTWKVRMLIIKQRAFLWDEKLLDELLQYSIRYHPLLNVYQVTDQYHGRIDSFTVLSTALQYLGVIQCSLQVKPDMIKPNSDVIAELKVEFDKEALPLPLRPVAYFDSSWNLSSDWYRWKVGSTQSE